MKRYEIQVTREAMASTLVRLNADNEDEAIELAKEHICEPKGMSSHDWWVLDHEWTVSDCEYHAEVLAAGHPDSA